MTRFGPLALTTMPLLALVRGPVARIPVRISWVATLSAMGRDPALGRLCAADPRGGGARIPLGFLATYLRHRHPAARSAAVPVHLLHPEKDDWTPAGLSERTLRTLPGAAGSRRLRECGHFPLEDPGLADLASALQEIAESVADPGS